MSKTIFKDCVNIAGVDHQNNYNHKTYHFANYENNLKVGDKVLTNNGCGMAISTVVEILDNNETAPCVTNQIVCKLDTTALLDSTFGMPAMEMLDELIGSYKIDSSGKLEDPVNHPSHYTDGSIEVIDFIEDKKLGYHLGNSVKYICRAGKKDPTKTIEDLKKAIWYINRHIKTLEK